MKLALFALLPFVLASHGHGSAHKMEKRAITKPGTFGDDILHGINKDVLKGLVQREGLPIGGSLCFFSGKR
jgi:hypothetical protein